MHDPIKLAFWAGGISLIIALGCAFYVVAERRVAEPRIGPRCAFRRMRDFRGPIIF
jgi:hypothetical protein